MNGWSALVWGLLGPALLMALAPLLDGLGRQVRARLESRAGPPWLQGYVDLAKLAGKEDVDAGAGRLATVMPYLAIASAVAAGLLLPFGGHAPLGFAGDAVAFVYLLGLSTAALVIGGAATGNPYAFLGAGREMLLLLFVEPVVAGALFVLAVKTGSLRLDALVSWQAAHGPSVSTALAAAAALVALLAYLGRIPFDLSEAEQELTGGILVEIGGRPLALYRWALFVRWLVVTWLVMEVFIPTPVPAALGLPLAVVKAFALFAVAAVGSTLLARTRLDRARALLIQVGLLVLFAMVFALIGA